MDSIDEPVSAKFVVTMLPQSQPVSFDWAKSLCRIATIKPFFRAFFECIFKLVRFKPLRDGITFGMLGKKRVQAGVEGWWRDC